MLRGAGQRVPRCYKRGIQGIANLRLGIPVVGWGDRLDQLVSAPKTLKCLGEIPDLIVVLTHGLAHARLVQGRDPAVSARLGALDPQAVGSRHLAQSRKSHPPLPVFGVDLQGALKPGLRCREVSLPVALI